MSMTDPVADFLTRIRNAQAAKHETVSIPLSNLKQRIADVLVGEGFARSARVQEDGVVKSLVLELKYTADGSPVIREIRRVSRPGRRVYVQSKAIPKVKNGLGIAVISTSKGVVVDQKARELKLGGELLCTVW